MYPSLVLLLRVQGDDMALWFFAFPVLYLLDFKISLTRVHIHVIIFKVPCSLKSVRTLCHWFCDNASFKKVSLPSHTQLLWK